MDRLKVVREQIQRRLDLQPRASTRFSVIAVAVAISALLLTGWIGALPAILLSCVTGIAIAALVPHVQEITRPRPRLKLSVTGTDDDCCMEAPRPSPWPIDIDAIVDSATGDALATISRPTPMTANARILKTTSDPFVVQPSEEDHEAAEAEFRKRVEAYGTSLQAWLTSYQALAQAHSETFEMRLAVVNTSKMFAEALTVLVELPETVTLLEQVPDHKPPPDQPRYAPPQPRRIAPFSTPTLPRFTPPSYLGDIEALLPPRRRTWDTSDPRCALTTVAEAHAQHALDINEPLLLRAHGAGEHEIHWRILTKSLRQPATGTVTLVVPANDESRPPFQRLDGILAFPDVPLESRGEIAHPVRTDDPPPCPELPPNPTAQERIQHRLRMNQWLALGLDPGTGGRGENERRSA